MAVDPRAGGEALGAVPMSDRSAGSIPAQAGKPTLGPKARSKRGVDPRAGGEAGLRRQLRERAQGRSPRRRGSRLRRASEAHRQRSIPAQAGEPAAAVRMMESRPVDPRAGGEAAISRIAPMRPRGRSPRRRGSPGFLPLLHQFGGRSPRRRGSLEPTIVAANIERSIPAQAGKPFGSCGRSNA